MQQAVSIKQDNTMASRPNVAGMSCKAIDNNVFICKVNMSGESKMPALRPMEIQSHDTIGDMVIDGLKRVVSGIIVTSITAMAYKLVDTIVQRSKEADDDPGELI